MFVYFGKIERINKPSNDDLCITNHRNKMVQKEGESAESEV